MVSSSKKKRGQHRKKDRVPKGLFTISMDNRSGTVNPDLKEQLIQYIRGGNDSVTFVLAENNITNFSLVDSGVLSAVLNHLKRCEHESLEQVVTSSERLKSPSRWIKILLRAAESEPSCMLQIADNIGPLVKCICNDMERVFFKSNKHWREGIVRFVELVGSILNICLKDNSGRKIIHVLLQNEGLLTTIIQWGFWDKHRPDISNELCNISADLCKDIAYMGRSAISALIIDFYGVLKDGGKEKLLMIGTTPVVSKSYDSTCMVSFVAGVVCYAKTEGWNEDLEWEEEDLDVSILTLLFENARYVDKGVITEMIDWGLNYVADLNDAVEVTSLSTNMISKKTSGAPIPCDTRVAFAIRAGLIDMLLSYIDRFQEKDPSKLKASLFYYIANIFFDISQLSLHQKTAKAIRSKRSSILEKLVRLEHDTNITSNAECIRLLEMVRSILGISGSYCCRCNKQLSRTEVMECNGCHRMTYCSRACQKEDWFKGHKLACCKTYAPENVGHFQGRVVPESMSDERAADKLMAIENNMTMIQLKLFLDNAENILSQAKTLGIPLCDCVAMFNLRHCPMKVEVKKYTGVHMNSQMYKEGFEETRSKENITCVYFSFILNGELDEDYETPVLQMQKFFPHEWITNKK